MMTREGFGEALARVREGTLSFDAFARQTKERWRRVAIALLRRWDAPSWAGTEEDVVQDLLLAAWQAIPRWDPTDPRQRSLEDVVMYAANNRAKKNLHRARLGKRAHRDEDHTRSRYERPLSSFVREGESGEEVGVPTPSVPARQDEVAELRRACARARGSATTVRELLAFQALEASDGEVEAAAALLYGDREARFEAGLGCEGDAFRAAARAASRVLGKLRIATAARAA